jgi:amino acid permease
MGNMKKRIQKTNTPMKALLTSTTTDSTDYRYGSLLNNPGNGSDIEDAENLSLQGEIHELTIEIDAFDKLAIIVNCLNALFGVALFVMPWGFQESGILGGLIIVSTVSVLSYETARILLLSQKSYYIEQGQIKSYPEIASAALGAKYHYIVQVATVISCLGGCTGYLIFLGQTLGQVFSIPAENVVIIGTLPLVLLSWVRTFSDLSYSTTLGIVAVVASIIALFADGMDHIIGDWTSVPLFIPSKAPNFLGPSTFLFTIHYCILSMGAEFLQSKRSMLLHNDTEDNQGSSISININLLFSSLSESIAISYVLTTATTVLVGCLGYLMYRNVSLVVDADGIVMPGCEQPVCQNVILNISPGIMRYRIAYIR